MLPSASRSHARVPRTSLKRTRCEPISAYTSPALYRAILVIPRGRRRDRERQREKGVGHLSPANPFCRRAETHGTVFAVSLSSSAVRGTFGRTTGVGDVKVIAEAIRHTDLCLLADGTPHFLSRRTARHDSHLTRHVPPLTAHLTFITVVTDVTRS